MTLPLIHTTGMPYAQGVQHGEALKARVAHNVDVYFDRFAREVQLPRAETLTRAEDYSTLIQTHNADYFEGMRGIADGSGRMLLEIVALNMRYEILYYRFGKLAMDAAKITEPDGCTAFAVLPEASANGHLLLGQNWDWIPETQGAVVQTTDADGFQTLAFTEAGIFGGKIGLNSSGLGLCINGMTTTSDDWARPVKPFHVRCYEILHCTEFDNALKIITDEARACSTNFLVAQTPDKIVDVEAAPDKITTLTCDDGRLVHTNHFLNPAETGIAEPPNPNRIYSYHRRDRMGELLRQHTPVSASEVEEYMRDHQEKPFSVCRHRDLNKGPAEHYITVTGVVMDLNAKTMALTDGPPCESEFQRIGL